MNRRRKTLAIVVGLAVALAGGIAIASTANAADPASSYTASHGRLVQTVYNPTNRAQFVQLAVDNHYGYTGTPDSTADFTSPVGRISKGSGAVRVAVDDLRTGTEAGGVVDDYRVSADVAVRDNGLLPALSLNSGAASQALGFGDWRPVPKCGGPQVAVRAYFSVRWADGSLSHPSLRSNYTQPNGTACPPVDGLIHPVSPFVALDTAAYVGADTPQIRSVHSRILDANTADLTWVAGETAAAGGTSAETNNLGVTLRAGDTLSVDYALINGANPGSDGLRLFAYCGDVSTAGHRPADAPDYTNDPDVAGPVPTSGTLTLTATATCAVTYAGVTYDNLVAGTVRVENLRVNTSLVSFS